MPSWRGERQDSKDGGLPRRWRRGGGRALARRDGEACWRRCSIAAPVAESVGSTIVVLGVRSITITSINPTTSDRDAELATAAWTWEGNARRGRHTLGPIAPSRRLADHEGGGGSRRESAGQEPRTLEGCIPPPLPMPEPPTVPSRAAFRPLSQCPSRPHIARTPPLPAATVPRTHTSPPIRPTHPVSHRTGNPQRIRHSWRRPSHPHRPTAAVNPASAHCLGPNSAARHSIKQHPSTPIPTCSPSRPFGRRRQAHDPRDEKK